MKGTSGQGVAETIRRAIAASGESRYAICQRAGIEQAAMSRFMRGGGLRIETLELIAEALGLEIVVRGKSRTKGG